jgi:hypothetical protein
LAIKKADVKLIKYALDAGGTASQMVARARGQDPIFPTKENAMNGRSANTYRKLAVGLLAVTGAAGLTARAILAQSNPLGPAASTVDEPIKRTVLFRGDLEGAPGKQIVVFVADLAPGAVGSKHYHPGPEFFYVLEGTFMSRKAAHRT